MRLEMIEKTIIRRGLREFITQSQLTKSSFIRSTLYTLRNLLNKSEDVYEFLNYFLIVEFLITERYKKHKTMKPIVKITLTYLQSVTLGLDNSHNDFSQQNFLLPTNEFSKKLNLNYQLTALAYQPSKGILISPLRKFFSRCADFNTAFLQIGQDFLAGLQSSYVMERLKENCGELLKASEQMYQRYYSFTDQKIRRDDLQLEKLATLKRFLKSKMQEIQSTIQLKNSSGDQKQFELDSAFFDEEKTHFSKNPLAEDFAKILNLSKLLKSLSSQVGGDLTQPLSDFFNNCRNFIKNAKKICFLLKEAKPIPILKENLISLGTACSEILYHCQKFNRAYLPKLQLLEMFLFWETTKIETLLQSSTSQYIPQELIRDDLSTDLDFIYDEMIFFSSEKFYKPKNMEIKDISFVEDYISGNYSQYFSKINQILYFFCLLVFQTKDFTTYNKYINILNEQWPLFTSLIDTKIQSVKKLIPNDPVQVDSEIKKVQYGLFMFFYLWKALEQLSISLDKYQIYIPQMRMILLAVGRVAVSIKAQFSQLIAYKNSYSNESSNLKEKKQSDAKIEKDEHDDSDDNEDDDDSEELNYQLLIKKFVTTGNEQIIVTLLSFSDEQLSSCCQEILKGGSIYLDNLRTEIKSSSEVNKVQTYIGNLKSLCVKLNKHYHERLTTETDFQPDLLALLIKCEDIMGLLIEDSPEDSLSTNLYRFDHGSSSSSASSSSSSLSSTAGL